MTVNQGKNPEDFNTAGAIAGGAVGAILGTKIAVALTVASGGWGIAAAPHVIVGCTLFGAHQGGGSPKSLTFPAMGAADSVFKWLGGAQS